MKKINFSFKNHFIHRIYLYIIAVLVIPAIVTYGVILKTNPKAEEIFTVFIEANIKDEDGLKSFIKEHTNRDNKEIIIYSSLSSMNTYEIIYQTQGLDSDILILSDNAFKNDNSSNYVELKEDNAFYKDTNKMVNDKHFGIEIYNQGEGYLADYIKYNEDNNYYVFINNGSVHTTHFSDSGKTEQIYKLLEAIYG